MFIIQGTAEFSECDMSLGESFERTLVNEGFGVKKEYVIGCPSKLVIQYGVCNRDAHKVETEFHVN